MHIYNVRIELNGFVCFRPLYNDRHHTKMRRRLMKLHDDLRQARDDYGWDDQVFTTTDCGDEIHCTDGLERLTRCSDALSSIGSEDRPTRHEFNPRLVWELVWRGFSVRSMAEMFLASEYTVRNFCKDEGIELRFRPRERECRLWRG